MIHLKFGSTSSCSLFFDFFIYIYFSPSPSLPSFSHSSSLLSFSLSPSIVSFPSFFLTFPSSLPFLPSFPPPFFPPFSSPFLLPSLFSLHHSALSLLLLKNSVPRLTLNSKPFLPSPLELKGAYHYIQLQIKNKTNYLFPILIVMQTLFWWVLM